MVGFMPWNVRITERTVGEACPGFQDRDALTAFSPLP